MCCPLNTFFRSLGAARDMDVRSAISEQTLPPAPLPAGRSHRFQLVAQAVDDFGEIVVKLVDRSVQARALLRQEGTVDTPSMNEIVDRGWQILIEDVLEEMRGRQLALVVARA